METENIFDRLRSSPPKSTEVEASTAISKDEAVYRPECNSPDPSCAICLGKLENKSFTDSCFHQFCFTCLLEWSKVKAECPLCKQSFKSIIHNVRSIEDYDQYHLRAEEPPRSWESPDGWRFRYRSTLTSERRREMALERRLLGHVSRSACIYRSLRNHRPAAVTTDFRRTVYDRNWWVQPMELTRYRDVSPQFYRANPACTHRLIPWLNRELVVLLREHESRISFVLELILSLIQRYEILSPEFREHVRPYIFGRTEHFIHEFYNYARCPWDMRAYDQRAQYRDSLVMPSSPDSNDSDIIIVDTPGVSASNAEGRSASQILSLINQTNSAPTTSQAAAGASTDAETHNPETPAHVTALERVKNFLSNVGRTGWESPSTSAPAWESPTRNAGSVSGLPNLISIPFLPSSPQPGPSGMTHFLQSVREDSDSSSSGLLSTNVGMPFLERASGSQLPKMEQEDDCLIVACVKPTRERTPVIVDLVTDSDSDSVTHIKHEPEENNHRRSSRSRRTTSRSSTSSFVTPSTSRSPTRSLVGSSSRSRTVDPGDFSSPASLPNDSKSSKRRPPSSTHSFDDTRRESRSSSPSPDRWRWTAYENGGGKLQRSYSRSSSGERLPRLPSVVGEVHGMLAKRKKHKKHKHKHKSHHHHHHHDSKHKFKKHCKGHKNSSKSHH